MLTWRYCLLVAGMGWLLSCENAGTKVKEKTELNSKVAISTIEAGIKAHIAAASARNAGFFELVEKDQPYRFKLVRVHTEYLSDLGNGRYFACVDLVDTSGDVYDVDFFMEGEPNRMQVTETSIHKLNGKPFYAWKQQADRSWKRVPFQGAVNALLGIVEGKDAFTFHYEIELPAFSQTARLWLPSPAEDAYQQLRLKKSSWPVAPRKVRDLVYGNEVLYFELPPSSQKQNIQLIYEVVRKEKSPYVADLPLPRDLQADKKVPLGGKFLVEAQQAMGNKRAESKLIQARALYDYVIDNMRYMKYGAFGQGDANYACNSKTGNCSEFHAYFIALARSVGIPARFAVGVAVPSDRNEGGIDGYHCWAEFYADGKWWPVDISEANKYSALSTYYFGHHPANRLEFSRGRDLLLDPMPASGPINFLAYPVFEVGGKVERPATVFRFERKEGA